MLLKQLNEILFILSIVLSVCFGIYRPKNYLKQTNPQVIGRCVDSCILNLRQTAADSRTRVKQYTDGANVKDWCETKCYEQYDKIYYPSEVDCEKNCLETLNDYPEFNTHRKERFCFNFCME